MEKAKQFVSWDMWTRKWKIPERYSGRLENFKPRPVVLQTKETDLTQPGKNRGPNSWVNYGITQPNLYEPLMSENVGLDNIKNNKPYPCLEPYFIHQKIKTMKNNSATVKGDIPIKIIKRFGYELSFPLSDICKRSCRFGEYPNISKKETITPAPKCYPPKDPTELRKISGTLNFSKIY